MNRMHYPYKQINELTNRSIKTDNLEVKKNENGDENDAEKEAGAVLESERTSNLNNNFDSKTSFKVKKKPSSSHDEAKDKESDLEIPVSYKKKYNQQDRVPEIEELDELDYKNLFYEAKNELHRKEIEVIELKYKAEQAANQRKIDTMPSYYKIKKNYINQLKYDFPDHNKIKDEADLRELYTKLLIYYNELYVDREQILDSLKVETISNEEQKAYIEMLRETVAKTFDSKGKPMQNNSLDYIIDLSRMRSEAEKFRKELIIAQSLINELRKENDVLGKELTILKEKKQRAEFNMEEKIKESDNTRGKIAGLESEKRDILDENREIARELELVKKDLEIETQKNRKMEIELFHYTKKVQEYDSKLQNKGLLQGKLLEVKKHNDQLKDDFDRLVKKMNKLDIDNKHYLDDNDALSRTIKELEDKVEELERKSILERKKSLKATEEQDNKILDLEKQRNLLNKLMKEKEAEFQKLEDKNEKIEHELGTYKSSSDSIYVEYEAFKKNSLEKQKIHERAIKDYQAQIFKLKEEKENLVANGTTLGKEISRLKLEIEKLEFDKGKLQTEKDGLVSNKDTLIEQYEKSVKSIKQLEEENLTAKNEKENYSSELKFWREKYDKDICSKIGELKSVYNDLSTTKAEFGNSKAQIIELGNIISDREDDLHKLELKNKSLENTVSALRSSESALNQKLETSHEKIRKLEKAVLEKEITISNLEQKVFLFEELERRNKELEEALSIAEMKIRNYESDQRKLKSEYENLLAILNEYEDEFERKYQTEEDDVVNENFTNPKSSFKLKPSPNKRRSKSEINSLMNSSEVLVNADGEINTKAFEKDKERGFNSTTSKNISEVFEKKLLKFLVEGEEKAKQLEILKGENQRLLKKEEFFLEQLGNLKNSDGEKSTKINYYQNLVRDIKLFTSPFLSTVKVYIEKFFKIANDLNNSQFTEAFCNEVSKLKNISIAPLVDNSLPEAIKILDEFTKLVSFELESANEKNSEYDKALKSAQERVEEQGSLLKEYQYLEEKWFIAENNYKKDINELKAGIEVAKTEIEEKRSTIDSKNRELNMAKLEVKNYNILRLEAGKIEEMCKKQTFENKELKTQMAGLQDEILNQEQVNTVVEKDKKVLESLLSRVVKSFHNREMSRLVNEIINVNFSIIQLSAEKSKYEKQIIQIERELKRFELESENKNYELQQTMLHEKENLKELILKHENKIFKKEMALKAVDEEYRKFEMEEKKSYETRYDNEIKYNKLEKELEDAKQEIAKTKKSGGFTNSDLKLSDNLGRTIYLEKYATAIGSNINPGSGQISRGLSKTISNKSEHKVDQPETERRYNYNYKSKIEDNENSRFKSLSLNPDLNTKQNQLVFFDFKR